MPDKTRTIIKVFVEIITVNNVIIRGTMKIPVLEEGGQQRLTDYIASSSRGLGWFTLDDATVFRFGAVLTPILPQVDRMSVQVQNVVSFSILSKEEEKQE